MSATKITNQQQHEIVVGYHDLKRNDDGSYSGTYQETTFRVWKESVGWRGYDTEGYGLSAGPFSTRNKAIEAICEIIDNNVADDPPPLPPEEEEAGGIVGTILGYYPEAAARQLAEDYPHVSKDVILKHIADCEKPFAGDPAENYDELRQHLEAIHPAWKTEPAA